jgi:hypothetical protein
VLSNNPIDARTECLFGKVWPLRSGARQLMTIFGSLGAMVPPSSPLRFVLVALAGWVALCGCHRHPTVAARRRDSAAPRLSGSARAQAWADSGRPRLRFAPHRDALHRRGIETQLAKRRTPHGRGSVARAGSLNARWPGSIRLPTHEAALALGVSRSTLKRSRRRI